MGAQIRSDERPTGSKPPQRPLQSRSGSRRLARTVDASTLSAVAAPRQHRERASSFSPGSAEDTTAASKRTLPAFVSQPRTISDVVEIKDRSLRLSRQESSSRLVDLVMLQIDTSVQTTKDPRIVQSVSEDSTSMASFEPDNNSSNSSDNPQTQDKQSSVAAPSAGPTRPGEPVFGRDWPLHTLGLALYDTPVGFSDFKSARARNGLATAEAYARDLFSFPHNAIRSQLVDVHDMLYGIVRRSRPINGRVRKPTSRQDDEAFLSWWNTFAAFVSTYFGMEEQILFPLAQPGRNTTPSEAAQLRHIMTGFWEQRAQLKNTVAMVSESVESLFVLPMHKVFMDIANCMDQLVPPLLEYMERQEAVLPQYICKSFPSFDIRSLEQARAVTELRIADYVVTKSANPRSDICTLGVWLNKTDERSVRWRKSSLRGTRKMLFPLWEARYIRTHKAAVERLARLEPTGKDVVRKNGIRATRSEVVRTVPSQMTPR